jgi:Bacterial Ig-like domain (group 3)
VETRADNPIATKSAAAKAIFPASAATVNLRLNCICLLLAMLLVTFFLPVSLRAQDVITTIAGENVAGVSFNLPTGLAVDAFGDLYVADTQNCVVWEVTNGVSTVIAGIPGSCKPGTGSGALQSLAYPIDVAVCGNNLYFATHGFDPVPSKQSITDAVAGGVYEISNGTFSTLPMPSGPVLAATPLFPVALACDSNGNVYLASYFYGAETLFTGSVDQIPAGSQTTQNWIREANIAYSGITVDSSNNVFALGTVGVGQGWLGTTAFAANGFIYQLTGNGGATAVLTGVIPNGLPNTSRLTANGLGNFLVTVAASDGKPTVYVEAVPGSIVAGNGTAGFKDGVQATLGELDNATGLAVDACGSIYVADSGNNVIRKILNPDTAGTAACASGPGSTGNEPTLTASVSIVQGNGQITAPGSVSFYSAVGIQNCTASCTTPVQGEVFFCSFPTASYISATSTDSVPCDGGATLGASAVSPTSNTSGNASYQASFLIPGTYYVVAEYFDPPYLPVTTGYVTVTACGASCTDSGVPNIPVASVPVALTPGALAESSNSGNGMIALDAKGNEYFLNSSAGTVILVDRNSGGGTIVSSSTAISSGGTLGAMNNLGDMVIGADGNLYVTDTGNNRVIQVVNPSSATPTVAVVNIGSSGGTLSPPLTAPMGIFETGDEVYVTDAPASGPRLVAFRPDGSFPTTVLNAAPAGTPPLGQLLGIAVNPTTLAIYVANSEAPGSTSGGSIIKTSIGGSASVVATPGLTLQSPYGIAMDASGGLYFSDTSTHLIYRMDIHGNVIVIAGNGTATERLGYSLLAETSVSAVQTGLANPKWLALDAANSVYILDGNNLLYLDVTQSIVDFTAAGESQTVYVTNPVAGTQGSVEMEFGSPLLNGADSYDFSVAAGTTCSQTSSTLLSPNTSCKLALTLNSAGSDATVTSCTLSQIEVSLGPPLTAGSCSAWPPGLTAQTIHLNAVTPAATTLQITGAATTGTYNVPYSTVAFMATGGSGQYTFSETGLLPSGMSLSPAGFLSGTPTQGGAFPFIVNVSDSQGDTGGLTQTLVINPAPTTTTLTATPNSLGVSQPFTLTATVLYNGTPVTSSNVAFYDYNGATLGMVPLNGSGQASFTATSPAAGGTYGYSATFQSTANLASSTGPTNITVTAIASIQNVSVSETILVTDSPAFPDVFDPEAIEVTDTPLIVPMPAPLTFALPVAYYSVGSVGFGTVAAGQTATQSFSLSNIGQGQLSLNGESISGSAFSLKQIECSNGASSLGASPLATTLPSSGACVFTISYFAPTGAAPTGAITFTDNSSLSNVTSTGSGSTYMQSIALNGSGTSTPPGPPPQMTVPVTVPEVIIVTDSPTFITPTTTTLTSSVNPASFGQNVVFTATVSSALGAPAGNVNFYDGGTLLGTGILSGGIATLGTTRLAVGTHSITANYTGNSATNFQASTSAVLNEFVGYPTKTVLTTSGSPSLVNQPVTFTATVSSTYGPIPKGETVTFYDGTTELGTGTTTGGTGVGTFTTSALSAKRHGIKATYAGDATFKTSSGNVVQVVDPYPTTTMLSTSLNPANFGEAVQLTAKVSNTSGSNIPSRNVKFMNGTTVLGIGTLDPTGTATLSTTKLPVGSNSITAEYEGDAENGASTSSVLTQIVNPAQITLSLSSLPDPSKRGQSVKFTATLTSNGGLPNGQKVTFSYGTTTLGATIVAGKAGFSTSALPPGSDVVTATYAGDADYSAASATTLQIVQ